MIKRRGMHLRTLWLFGHQLSMKWQALQQLDPQTDYVFMVEARSRGQWRHYHKQKLIYVYSAMRHFAQQLKQLGYQVDYRQADTFEQGFQAHYAQYQPHEVIVHLPTEWQMRQKVLQWAELLTKKEKIDSNELTENVSPNVQNNDQIFINIRTEDELFLVPETAWSDYLPDQKKWNLEQVYRKLRKRFHILMDGDQPQGGQWNFDAENRKGPDAKAHFMAPLYFEPDAITQQVIRDVELNFPDFPGQSEPFIWPVTQAQAEESLIHFLSYRLATFGTYQDAMLDADPFMSHSLVASSLNFGLLHPLDVIQQAEQCYHQGLAPLSAVEGFIRQILGWREYVRGVYLKQMPHYAQLNVLNHQRALPAFFWDGNTRMNCLHHAVSYVEQYAYNHHIQRLMVLCNFANLAGVSPQAVNDWFNEMYIDALDWVVTPNVIGMGLYADGGVMASKPYVSSGQYINRMSNSCKTCYYQVDLKVGERACPFHALYWSFIERHQDRWSSNPRMLMMVKSWRNMEDIVRSEYQQQATWILQQLDAGKL
jgi:deoxyribodipyrimidine photolyase-related protein